MSHLFGGTGFLGLGHGGFVNALKDIAPAVAAIATGGLLAPALGLGEAATAGLSAAAGAGVGAATAGPGNRLVGALLGGAGGALAGTSGLATDVTDAAGLGTATAAPVASAGTDIATGAGTMAGTTASGAPLGSAVGGAGTSAASIAAPPAATGSTGILGTVENALGIGGGTPATPAPLGATGGSVLDPAMLNATSSAPTDLSTAALAPAGTAAAAGGGPTINPNGTVNLTPASVTPGATAAGSAAAQPQGLVGQVTNALGLGGSGSDLIRTAIAGLGLAKDLTTGNTVANFPGYSQILTAANTLAGQGTQLSSAIETGQLPPGAQDAINQATQSAIAAVKSSYASRGIAPNSPMEIQDINNIQQQAAASAFQVADQLLTQGTSDAQISASLYNQLLNLNVSQNQETVNAIASLSAALSGGTTYIPRTTTTTTPAVT